MHGIPFLLLLHGTSDRQLVTSLRYPACRLLDGYREATFTLLEERDMLMGAQARVDINIVRLD